MARVRASRSARMRSSPSGADNSTRKPGGATRVRFCDDAAHEVACVDRLETVGGAADVESFEVQHTLNQLVQPIAFPEQRLVELVTTRVARDPAAYQHLRQLAHGGQRRPELV